MPTLTVAGHDVTVGDEFTKLSPEDQQAMVNHIAQHLPGQKTSEEPSGVVAGVQHGLAGVINGPASTVGLTGLDTPTVEGPKNYKSAPIFDKDGVHLSNIPQALAEAAPGLTADIIAGKTGAMVGNKVGGVRGVVVGGLGGFMGSALLRNFGPGAHDNADARTGVPNSPVEGKDLTREASKQALEAIPNMFVGGRMVPGVAKEAAGSVLAKLGKTGLIGGGAGAANDVIDQVGTTAGSKDGIKYDPLRTANAATTGALLNTALASPKAASEASANRKFSGYEATPETTAAAQAVASRREAYADGRNLVGPLGGTKVAAEVANNAHKDIHAELAAATRSEELSHENTRTLQRINDGTNVAPGLVAKLGEEATPETMHLVQQALISKNENARGHLTDNSYSGGIGGAMENLPIIRTPIKAALTTGGAAALGALGVPGVGHAVGAVALPAAAATAGVYGVGRMIDRFTGARSPATAFNERFGGTDTPTRIAPPEPLPADPLTTSVPQVAPPQAAAQPWGTPLAPEPKGPTPSQQNADIRGMLLMAAARRKMAEAAQQPVAADVPAPAPEAPNISPTALAMVKQKMKKGLPPEPAPEAPAPAPEPEAPSFNPTALSMLKQKLKQGLPPEAPTVAPAPEPSPAAPVISPVALMMLKKQLKIGLPPEPAGVPAPPPAPVAAPVAPADPAAQAAPTDPAPPTISQLINKMRATSAAKAAQNPAATPPGGVVAPEAPMAPTPDVLPTPPVSQLSKLKGQPGIKEKTGASEYMDPDTGELLSHTPLTKDQLYGRDMTHEEFARHESAAKLASGELKPGNKDVYESGVIHDRLSRERELQLLSQHEAGPDDTPLAKLLLQELHHTRREADAHSAIKFYTSHMSPGMRRASAHLMSRHGPFTHMWSK